MLFLNGFWHIILAYCLSFVFQNHVVHDYTRVHSISHFLLAPCTTRISQIMPALFKNPKASLNVFS
ncbi:hypothetical protein Hanom_Chr10g00920881 [Helianthus anomalus]